MMIMMECCCPPHRKIFRCVCCFFCRWGEINTLYGYNSQPQIHQHKSHFYDCFSSFVHEKLIKASASSLGVSLTSFLPPNMGISALWENGICGSQKPKIFTTKINIFFVFLCSLIGNEDNEIFELI